MYYTELIQKFWHFNVKAEVGPTAIAMYLYLLKLANDTNGYAVTISDVVLSKNLGITRKTVKTTKQKLKKLGVIDYGIKIGISGSYRIIVDYPFWEVDHQYVATEKSQSSKIQTQKKRNDAALKYGKKNNSEIKPIPNNHEIIIIEQPKIPKLEEFLEYAQTLEAFVPPLIVELTKKYHLWKENDWKNNSNRPITNWKLSLKQILPYMRDNVKNEKNPVSSIPTIKIPQELENHQEK